LEKPETDCEYKIVGSTVHFCGEVIEGADAKTFTWIDAEYAKDKRYVYFGTERFEIADPATFKVLDHGLSKDKDHVYYNYYSGKMIPGADPGTFEIMSFEVARDHNAVYIRDESFNFVRLKEADAHTFTKHQEYFVDKNYLYNFAGEIIAKRDTFDVVDFFKGS
jgi:hypothetical protein